MSEVVTIELTQGYLAQIDAEDANNVSRFKWCASIRRSRRTGEILRVYAMSRVGEFARLNFPVTPHTDEEIERVRGLLAKENDHGNH